MGDTVNDQQNNEEEIEQQATGATDSNGGVVTDRRAADPDTAEVKALYEDLGITAPVPTGKAKGRPKAADVRAEDDKKNGAGSSDSGSKGKDADDKNKSANASDSNNDDDSGNKADSKGKKNGSDDDEISDESGKTDKAVRDAKSKSDGDSEQGREKDADQRNAADESTEHEQGGKAEGESTDEEGVKRPGKSNPEVEKRFQQLTAEKKAAEQRAVELEKKYEQKIQAEQAAKIAESDPEYKLEDFRKVRDNSTGEIKELSEEQAELAWRRWKEGYDGRAEEREAKVNYATRVQQNADEQQREMMKKSVEAYDALAALQDEYPELVSTSDKFDKDFAADALPIIKDAMEYLPGTEPGNAEDKLPIIVGLKINPKQILDALKRSNARKRDLPLNGVNDNVESRSNVAVPHSRSSDPTVNAANELMKELKINKRF